MILTSIFTTSLDAFVERLLYFFLQRIALFRNLLGMYPTYTYVSPRCPS
jgi:hypothetical protein